MRSLLVMIVAVLTMGCANRLPLQKLKIDPGFSPEGFEMILDAVDEHNAANPDFAITDIVVSSTGRSRILPKNPEQCLLKGKQRLGITKLEWSRRPNIWICVPDTHPNFRGVVLHELGHALAARKDHLPPGHVMSNPFTDGHLTEDDIEYITEGRKESP